MALVAGLAAYTAYEAVSATISASASKAVATRPRDCRRTPQN